MSNSRLINKGYFNHPKIASLSLEERYLLVGLMCTANDWGKFWSAAGNIRSQVFPTDNVNLEKIDEMILNLQQLGFVCLYEFEDIKYGHFPEWRTKGSLVFQRLDHPRKDTEIPSCPLHEKPEKGSKITRNFNESSRTIEKKGEEENSRKETEYNKNNSHTSIVVDSIAENVTNVLNGRNYNK